MGSLISGWDSPTSNSPKGRFERNKSLTNEEIETFWKIKRKDQEEHLKGVPEAQVHATSDIQSPTDNNNEVSEAAFITVHQKLAANRPVGLDTSKTYPGCNTTVAADSQFANDDLHNLGSAKAWWRKSNSAFLNETPLMEGPPKKYIAQHQP